MEQQMTLKQLRDGYGLTQKELARLFKVSDRTIYNIEKILLISKIVY